MKKILLILGIVIFGMSARGQDLTLTGGVDFDWVNISQIERDAQIDMFRPAAFDGTKPQFDRKKDTEYRKHTTLLLADITETENADMCAFRRGQKSNILYMYALQYKNEPRKTYYYSLLGKLYYVDIISGNYPDFPYTSHQYRANGKPVSMIYFKSPDIQYMYKPDGEFEGIWYKEKMFDSAGKQLLTRNKW